MLRKTRLNMKLQKLLFSKLIKACEMDWIPEADSIYGEPTFSKSPPEGLKTLIYRQNRQDINPQNAKNNLNKIKAKTTI